MRGGRAASDSDATDESLRSVVSPAQVFPETYWSRAPVGPCVLLTHAVVVDDVKSNRDLFGRMLARRGVTTIHYAGDGLEAVALLDNLLDADLAKIQCWFTDKEMPNCDGHELSQHLRARGISAPIFGVSGNALAEDRRLFIAAGVDAVITKPVSMDAVESALLQHGLRLLPAPAASGHSSQATTPRPDGREHL